MDKHLISDGFGESPKYYCLDETKNKVLNQPFACFGVITVVFLHVTFRYPLNAHPSAKESFLFPWPKFSNRVISNKPRELERANNKRMEEIKQE